ncbi:hypothetical protein EPN15_00690 [Patescibacteria group bacterium]|nr:MAG: hypothetical protein EPN15_00690 [Patescibacteria group bacterium]
MIRFSKNKILIAGFVAFAALLFTPQVFAKELVKETNLNEAAVKTGYTVKTDDNAFAIGVQSEAAAVPLKISINKLAEDELLDGPAGYARVSDVYEFDIKGQDGSPVKFAKQFSLKLKTASSDIYRKKVLFFWDKNKNQWRPFKGLKENLKTKEVTAFSPFSYAQAAVFEHPTTVEGYASWYNYQLAKNRKKYADGVATHLYPQGTKLKITNLENGKSTQVKVVSYWDKATNEKRRRALDIVKASFSKIASVSEGVIPVRVEVIKQENKKIAATGGGTPDQANKTVNAPVSVNSLKSRAAIVIDEGGNTLFEKNSDKVYPIASLSKLFTAEAFLQTNPDWKKQVKLILSDDAEGAKLFSPAGDVVTVKDLFYSMLTGSTNNGAKALARSTGLSNDEFAAKMNELAKSAGLKNAKFYEPTGLDIRNTATAKEIALFSLNNLNRKEIIEGTTKSVYSFDEILSVDKTIHHDVKSTNILLKESHPAYEILASKTGFLYESLHCLMMKVKSKKDGRIYTAVILGGPTSAVRFNEMRALLAEFVP